MKRVSPLQRMFARKQRRTARRKTAAPAVLADYVRVPYRCVILAIDPGENSGWAVFAHGKLVQFGEVNVFDHAAVARIVQKSIDFASIAGDPLVLVMEKPFRAASAGGETGPSRGLWRHAWKSAGCGERRIVGVLASQWRPRLLGRGAGTWKRDIARASEQQYAALIAQHAASSSSMPPGPDASPAICIGVWGSLSPRVGKVLPASVRKLSEVAA